MGLLQDALTTEIVVDNRSYIFDEAGGMRDQLEQTILNELEIKKYPFPTTIQNVKSGGMFFGSKEQCVTIEVVKGKRVVIANTTVGTYLYVSIYLLRRVPNDPKMILPANAVTDIFETQRECAAYSAAVEATESAFEKLALKQCNSGYRSSNQK